MAKKKTSQEGIKFSTEKKYEAGKDKYFVCRKQDKGVIYKNDKVIFDNFESNENFNQFWKQLRKDIQGKTILKLIK